MCPHPPLLVAGLGPERGDEVDALREACWSALDALRSSSPDVLVVVGTGESTVADVRGTGNLAPYGAERTVVLPGAGPSAGELPLSLSVGAWLLEHDGWPDPAAVGAVTAATVAAVDGKAGGAEVLAACARLGEEIAERADRVALLVMADGSASREQTAPRPFHPRAEEYDAAVAQALREGEPQQLMALDAALAADVGSSGLGPLRVLASAAADAVFDAEVLYDAAPYGVGYVVGVWERHG